MIEDGQSVMCDNRKLYEEAMSQYVKYRGSKYAQENDPRLIAERKAREEEERSKAVSVKLETLTQQTADFAETLYQYLLDNDGECNLGDKSEADDIYERFHVSKKVYKRAIGDLYKKRLITVSPMSIRLAE